MNKAIRWIIDLSYTVPDEEAAAYRALADAIRASRAERERARDEALARSQELFDRYEELQAQFQRAATATMPRSTP